MSERKYSPPLLPDGAEIVIGLIMAAIVWWTMSSAYYPFWAFAPVMILVFWIVYFSWSMSSEADRLYVKSQRILNNEIRPRLETIRLSLPAVSKREAESNLNLGFRATQDAIDELLKLDSGAMFTGLSEVNTWTRRLGEMLPEYLDIQDHPSKAGVKRTALMTEDEDGFVGFRDWAQGMSERVNKGEVFNMTTNARLLRSLKSLIPLK